jgi:hypothetical protein
MIGTSGLLPPEGPDGPLACCSEHCLFCWKNEAIRAMLTTRELLKLAPCALIFLVSHTLCAQEASKILAGDLAKHCQVLKTLSLDVARAIPENAYTPKAALAESDPNSMGPFELGALALENVLSCSSAFGTRAPARFQSAFDRPMDATKTGVITNLTVAYDFCIDGLNQINDANLLKTALRGLKGHPATKFDIIWDAFAHTTHRLGKAEMYLRLKGITPPDVGPSFAF